MPKNNIIPICETVVVSKNNSKKSLQSRINYLQDLLMETCIFLEEREIDHWPYELEQWYDKNYIPEDLTYKEAMQSLSPAQIKALFGTENKDETN